MTTNQLTIALAIALLAPLAKAQGDRGFVRFGPQCGARLEGRSTVVAGERQVDLTLAEARPNMPTAFVLGNNPARTQLPESSCVLLTDPLLWIPTMTDALGRAHLRFEVPMSSGVLVGQALQLQANKLVASDGVRLLTDDAHAGPTACPGNCAGSYRIIGCDDREPGPKSGTASKEPWNMVGRVYIDGAPKGSGTLISARYVLTAAHVVYDAKGFRSGPIGFSLAQTAEDCSKRPLGTRYVKRVFVPRNYSASDLGETNKALDFALLELANPLLGGHVMDVEYLSWITIYNRECTAIGYPGDANSLGEFAGSAFYCRGSFTNTQPFKWLDGGQKGLLRSDNDGVGGMSGGPMYVWYGGVRRLVGVFIGGSEAACESGKNWSARIMSSTILHIENAKKFPPNGNVIDFFWRWNTVPLQADVNYYCGN
ncbi:MAG: trypsin-like peptidase domain-containing protein [Planctomycetes bacterium]|nr:trypsin-like peptidase domain-containing protein [Planctomycetota bacterium]